MFHNKLIPFALLALSAGGFAAHLHAAPLPSAGGQLQQIPSSPTLETLAPEIEVQQQQVPARDTDSAERIEVNSLRLSGQSLYTENELLELTGFRPGSQLSLGDLQAMASRITDFYHRNDYFLAQAYLPAQAIEDGVVMIAVAEGRYGDITLRNQSALSDRLPQGLLRGLESGDVINRKPLENRLLLMSDIPGVNVQSTLVPGASVGAADLIVDVTPGQRVTGSIDADNAGSYYTGEYRVGGTVHVNNLAGQGDVASVRVLSSFDGLNYARAAYQLQLGRATAGVAYSHLDYKLGKEFSALGAEGEARVTSLFGRYPLVRSRQTNLYAQIGYDHKTFEDRYDFISSISEKSADVVMASLYGDHRDSVGAGGLTAASVTLHSGQIDIETPTVREVDAVTARTHGDFNKLSLSVMRVQQFTDTFSLYGSLAAQFASGNLDSSEKMSLGGMNGVRAYPQGEAFADEGYLATLEARQRLTALSDQVPGLVHLIGFVDAGRVTLNKDPWDDANNSRTLSGAGVGLNWADYNNFSVKTYYAHKLGNEVATSAPDSDGQFWIQLVKYF
ncbi:ShlB/FhaC/HecB family hemolysin secretion/activation protein [Franzmannia qiaohouensis]|uniref:ShlB/FhaC/HecB family hemolysin secretion/activation protein n=1 Tax=Franzmannia qiaohouensis TaxID=1329370 RepID=A0ABU1HK41_9GAMM|nr:ShlB/FhaC/HecB family hemolysin secretion/activation protein [Halomonas qiaohouensis]MDR5907403.1 ShlB/FhaC/HecB family hemolysin secretion/activation protein [Halomonas qiaohouensis]